MSANLPPAVPRTASIMNRIVASSLRQRLLVVLMTLVLIGAGLHSLRRLPVDANPTANACGVFIPSVVSLPVFRKKVVLHVCDAVKASYHGGPGARPKRWNG